MAARGSSLANCPGAKTISCMVFLRTLFSWHRVFLDLIENASRKRADFLWNAVCFFLLCAVRLRQHRNACVWPFPGTRLRLVWPLRFACPKLTSLVLRQWNPDTAVIDDRQTDGCQHPHPLRPGARRQGGHNR